jgi:hypothetical protein
VELFPVLPDDLSELSGDELAELLAQSQEVAQKLADDDPELTEGLSKSEVIDVLAAGVDDILRLRGAIEAAAAKDAELEAKRAELAAQINPTEDEPDTPDEADHPTAESDTPDGEPEAETADGETDDASVIVGETGPEAIAAASKTVIVPRKRPPLRRAIKAAPEPEPREMVTITAAADIPGVPMGARITDRRGLREAFIARRAGIGQNPNYRRASEVKVPVATVHGDYPDDRFLHRSDSLSLVMDKVRSVAEQARHTPAQAIVAAGGLCAPVEPYYNLKQIATTQRPVRDALARFGADRGGIRFAPPPDLGDFSNAITVISEADDAAGGSAAVKQCLDVSCPEFQEVLVGIRSHCLTFHNLNARAWPEQVDNAVANTMAMHARVAETALLDSIAAGSKAVTASAVNGFSADFPTAILRAATGFRSRHRAADNATLRVLAPQWAEDAYMADLWATQFYRQSDSQDTLEAKLADAGVVISYYLDSPTGADQIFPVQDSSGAGLDDFPSEAVWYIFDEGGWLHLDAGALELGLVRDSVLNALNEYTMFGETFEEAAFIGIESIQVTQDVCLTGNTGGPTSNVCNGG